MGLDQIPEEVISTKFESQGSMIKNHWKIDWSDKSDFSKDTAKNKRKPQNSLQMSYEAYNDNQPFKLIVVKKKEKKKIGPMVIKKAENGGKHQ